MYYVYFLANKSNTVLYIGVTNDLRRRLCEHKQGTANSFTQRYCVHKLIYCEEYRDPREAIAREKQLKGWTRKRKEELIKPINPDWKDLSYELL